MGFPRIHLAIVILGAACNGGGWSSIDDCDAISAGAKADECYAEYAADVFRTDPERGIKIVEEKITDQRVKDFVWLTVTREVDPGSYKYCDRIEEEALAERCRVLVSRPHLHRELLKGGKAGDGPSAGGPPPAGGPGGPPGGGPPAGGPPAGGPPDGADGSK